MIVLHMITSDMAPGCILPEELGEAVRPASQNPYHTLRFCLPFSWFALSRNQN